MSQVLNTDEAIIRELARMLSNIFDKTWQKQSFIAEKMGISQWNVSLLLKWAKNTRKINNYRSLAYAIGVSEKEFEWLIEKSKKNVLGDFWENKSPSDPKVAFFANVGVTDKNKQDAIMKMIEAFKDV